MPDFKVTAARTQKVRPHQLFFHFHTARTQKVRPRQLFFLTFTQLGSVRSDSSMVSSLQVCKVYRYANFERALLNGVLQAWLDGWTVTDQ